VNSRARAQILPLFALVLTVLIGFSALVIDIGFNYAVERRYQSIADAASLAGAQELQPITRSSPVTAAMQEEARTEALAIVLDDLTGATTNGACDPSSDVDCTVSGGRYRIIIQTPSPDCIDCDPDRSVWVRVAEPAFSTTFARVLGQSTWNLQRTSVAGLEFGRSYTIVTLRPPQPLGSSTGFDVRDFRIEGGSDVVVSQGDVGTNANMEYGGTGSKLYLDSGYSMYYFDPIGGPDWSSPADPVGKQLGSMIEDPGYSIPGQPATIGTVAPEGAGSACLTAATSLLATGSTYAPYIPNLGPATPAAPDMGKIRCLLPGYFATNPGSGSAGNDTFILLTDPANHGLFYFGAGLTIQTSLIGGFVAGAPGVAVVIPQNRELNMNTSGGGTAPSALALNAGSKFLNSSGTEATAALNFAGSPIVTNGTPAIKMTLMVTRDPSCTVSDPYPTGCADTANDAIKIAGKSNMYLAGVQFMPTDNVSINSSAATGYIGQIWAWTLKYSGGVQINQQGSSTETAGVIRIDTACSPGAPACP